MMIYAQYNATLDAYHCRERDTSRHLYTIGIKRGTGDWHRLEACKQIGTLGKIGIAYTGGPWGSMKEAISALNGRQVYLHGGTVWGESEPKEEVTAVHGAEAVLPGPLKVKRGASSVVPGSSPSSGGAVAKMKKPVRLPPVISLGTQPLAQKRRSQATGRRGR